MSFLFGQRITTPSATPNKLPSMTNHNTSPLSSWFISGGAPNFGQPTTTPPATTATTLSLNSEIAPTKQQHINSKQVFSALTVELEEQEKFSQLLVKELGSGMNVNTHPGHNK